MLEVVTVWAPRPEHEKWRDYLPLLELQKKSAERVGHRHVVVTDTELPGYDTLPVKLPQNLMQAILAGQLEYVSRWSGEFPIVLADADCLVIRDLEAVFDGTFDVLLTSRNNPAAPIQNGAMYFAAGSQDAARQLLHRALQLCKEHWGGDQEAIAQAAAPVPLVLHVIEPRFGKRFYFASPDPYNFSPRGHPPKMNPNRFIVHFKGDTKHFVPAYARDMLGLRLDRP